MKELRNFEFIEAFFEGKPLKSKRQEIKILKDMALYFLKNNLIAVRKFSGDLYVSDCGFCDKVFYTRLKGIAYYVGCRVYRRKGIGYWENPSATTEMIDKTLQFVGRF